MLTAWAETDLDVTTGGVTELLTVEIGTTKATREQAYDAVQPLAMRAWQEQIPFKPLVQEDPVISRQLSSEVIDELFDLAHHSKQVDQIFARVGLD